MTARTIRAENPHHQPEPRPLLRGHPFRPFTFASGVVLCALGCVFFAHQVGALSLGPVPTIAGAISVGAMLLLGLAAGWSRRVTAAPVATDEVQAAVSPAASPAPGDVNAGDVSRSADDGELTGAR
ncbi:MAG: hypothetical protein U0R50_10825 [Gaiellales bacterium]